jgi:quercetin dioxygenase-like cupin family protein
VNSKQLNVVRIGELQLGEFSYAGDASARVRGTFPLSVASGTANTAAVYVEVEPGCRLGSHTDSAEEILIFLQGTAEVTVGDVRGHVSAGDMAVVPSMVPHGIRNTGDETLRFVGFFSSNTVMSTFEEPLVPVGALPALPESQRTMVTPVPGLLEQAPVAAGPNGLR